MNKDRNYNSYIVRMARGNQEKLFFLDKIDLHDYNTIIDFGCGAGDILATLAELAPWATPIGIDLDDYMRSITESKNSRIITFAELTQSMLNEKTLIIFNSVLHEVEDYWYTLKDIIKGTGATVVIRDMRFTPNNANVTYEEYLSNWSRIIAKSNPVLLADFVSRYGFGYKQIVHYLLKYTYVDNWKLEVKENYFSFDYTDLFTLGKVIYENNYTLEYKKNAVKEDFDIDLTDGTHTQIIMKLDKEN